MTKGNDTDIAKAPIEQNTAFSPVARLRERVENAFKNGESDPNKARNQDCRKVLARFLNLSGAPSNPRRVFEAMPHVDPIDTVQSFRMVLLRLGFSTTVEPASKETLRQEYVPCFIRATTGRILLIEELTNEKQAIIFEPESGKTYSLPVDKVSGTAIFPETEAQTNQTTPQQSQRWSTELLKAFRPIFGTIFLLGFLINLIALVPPLFVMHVYDKAIGASALDVLFGLTVGVLIVVAAEFGLRLVRGRLQAYLGARLDNQISNQAFKQLLYLPVTFTESAPVGSQLTRLNQITSIRDAFTGPLASAVFDLPFLFLFLIAIAMIGGSLVFIPVGLTLSYIALAAWALPTTRRLVKTSGDKKAQLQNLVVESVTHRKAICDLNAEDVWRTKHRRLSAESAMSAMKARQVNNLVQIVSQSFVTLAGVLVLAIGVNQVVAGDLSAGALIAVMALSWRVLNPIRAIFLSSLTFGQTLRGLDQIDRLLKIPLEREPSLAPSIPRTFEGDVIFDRISFRYPSQKEPALRGVSFGVKTGELLCICGASGSGKSTTLKLLAKLYQQQAGSIFVGGVDLRQVDAGEWRQSIGVAPEASDLFFGTVAQNLRLANPSARDSEIEEIGRTFKLDQYFGGALKNDYETKVTSAAMSHWPEALKKRLILCRAFLSEHSLYLLDNPADNLDDAGEDALLQMIKQRRANSKIVMTTHRPSHMRLADGLLWLDYGAVRKLGAPEELIPELLAA